MIVSWFFAQTIGVIRWVLSVSGTSLRLDPDIARGAVWLINYFFTDAASIFFFFIRPSTFWMVMDFLFLYWARVPLRYVKEWALTKIPHAGFH